MPNSIVAEYQSQPWLMEPSALKAFVERLAGLPATASLLGVTVAEKARALKVADGVARIAIAGVLLPSVPGWMRLWGLNVTGYDRITEQVSEAAERKDVTAIQLDVDSPGGTVAGAMQAADAIFSARQAKPVTAVISNLGASGAYWLASQAETVAAADANTLAGSIGVYTFYVDWTKFEDDFGVKVIVIRSGEHKAMGLDTITEAQIAAVQEYIDATAANFIDAVARGRGQENEKIAEQATGQLWIAATARELGLIDAVVDGVEQTNQTVTQSQGDETMDKNQTQGPDVEKITADASQAAEKNERTRMSELRVAFPDDPDFAIKAFTEGQTVGEAKAAYCDVLQAKLADQTRSAVPPERPAAIGESAIAQGDTDAGTSGDFLAEAREIAEEKKISVTAAMRMLARRKPELRVAFLDRCRTEGKDMYRSTG